jgi:tRNA A37 threonylcarbamoyladenosine modification protein TsaB
MIIDDNFNYNISYQNSKTNYEKLILLINEFLVSKNLDLKKISEIYVNRGPGSFAGIRNSLSVVKAIHLANKINYFCFSFKDFNGENEVKYELIPQLCEKFKVKKNLINPIYMS